MAVYLILNQWDNGMICQKNSENSGIDQKYETFVTKNYYVYEIVSVVIEQ
jgi:hypothetical protein